MFFFRKNFAQFYMLIMLKNGPNKTNPDGPRSFKVTVMIYKIRDDSRLFFAPI